ncbi:MAG: hypothetical protein ACTSRW_05210 [Candidatus Helarchaeota archaeon]
MGLYSQVEKDLGKNFSLQQFIDLIGFDKSSEKHEARNILNQFIQAKKIRRISKNMYQKIK